MKDDNAIDTSPATKALPVARPPVEQSAPLWRGRSDAERGKSAFPHVLIVDEFFVDPWEQRNIALSRDYLEERRADANYGGRDSLDRGKPTASHRVAAERIAGILGAPIRFYPYYRLNTEGTHDIGRSHIHCDEYDTGIIYLNPPDQCVSAAGTHFWRHRRLGWESFQDMTRAHPDRSEQELTEIYWTELGGGKNVADWELTLTVPMKWNRLLLFRGDLFHSTGQSFGSVKEDARLIQVVQFDVLSGRGLAA